MTKRELYNAIDKTIKESMRRSSRSEYDDDEEFEEDDYEDDDFDEEDWDEDEEELNEEEDEISEFGRRSRDRFKREFDEEESDYSSESPTVPIMLSGTEMEELKNGGCSKELFDKIQLKRELTCIHKMNDDETWKGIQREMDGFQNKMKNKTYKIKHRGIYG